MMAVVQWLELHMVIVVGVVFAAIAVTTYLPSRKKDMNERGMIPLRDDQ
jgi:cbb3-type cytochrome oxidase subunit 3